MQNSFAYRDRLLYCEGLSVAQIAGRIGTPFYLYSSQSMQEQFRDYDRAFASIPHVICFSMKANSNLAVVRLFVNEGGGVDIVSGGELFRAVRAGADPKKIVFSGVGKTREEIAGALKSGILMLNVESLPELRTIDHVAQELGLKAPVALRINPDVDPHTHDYTATGKKESKFGIDLDQAMDGYRLTRSLNHLEVVGVDVHIGSQITEVEPYELALVKVKSFVDQLRSEGFGIRYFDFGGGLGIPYKDEKPPSPREFADRVLPILSAMDVTVIFEPGRFLVGNGGILVCKVLYVKDSNARSHVIVDAAMNDLIRPSLYGAYQEIIPVSLPLETDRRVTADVVGPVCESGDFLGKDREIPPVQVGDMLAVLGAGAYGFTMSSNYNSRPRVPEALVRGGEFHVVRRRETFEDLVRGEEIPMFLRGG
ncbi:MAG TPA: diaminopimelate decarboxylase [bacterium]|nr:diaminopimelate decarboxylase [bacterium]